MPPKFYCEHCKKDTYARAYMRGTECRCSKCGQKYGTKPVTYKEWGDFTEKEEKYIKENILKLLDGEVLEIDGVKYKRVEFLVEVR